MNTKLALISLAAVATITASNSFAGELYEDLEDRAAPPARSASSMEQFNTSLVGNGELHQEAEIALDSARGSDAVKPPYTTSLTLGGELGSPKPSSDDPFGENSVFAE